VKMSYIPAKGRVPALRLVMGGDVKAGFNDLPDAYRNQERLKILAVAALERYDEFLPDVPTLKEAGYDVDNTSINYRGIMSPEGTPPEIVDFLGRKIPAMFKADKVQARMKNGAAPVKIMGREDTQKMWAEVEVTLKDLFKDLKKE